MGHSSLIFVLCCQHCGRLARPTTSFNGFILIDIAFPSFANGVAAAHWAARKLVACARIDDGLPDVPASALPPDFLAAAGEYMVRGKAAVHGWVPLGCDLGIFCGEIVKAGEHSFIGAVWAAAIALGAGGNDGLVFMPFVADPPDFAIAGGRDVVWGEGAVFCWVPFLGDGGILAGQVVFAGDDLFAGADWAAAALCAT